MVLSSRVTEEVFVRDITGQGHGLRWAKSVIKIDGYLM